MLKFVISTVCFVAASFGVCVYGSFVCQCQGGLRVYAVKL